MLWQVHAWLSFRATALEGEHNISFVNSRLVVLESGLKSIFAGLGLGKICNQVHFQFSLYTFAVFCLGRMTFCKPVSYTQPKISVTYFIFTAELTHGLACSYSLQCGMFYISE